MEALIKIADTDNEIAACYPVLCQLREDLVEDSFVKRVRNFEQNGYALAYLATGNRVKSVAGFHLGESFAWKRYLYVDDLVTDDEARGQGYGAAMIDWLYQYARDNACAQFHLDSSVTRYETHRFYLNRGLFIGGYHFLASLDDHIDTSASGIVT